MGSPQSSQSLDTARHPTASCRPNSARREGTDWHCATALLRRTRPDRSRPDDPAAGTLRTTSPGLPPWQSARRPRNAAAAVELSRTGFRDLEASRTVERPCVHRATVPSPRGVALEVRVALEAGNIVGNESIGLLPRDSCRCA